MTREADDDGDAGAPAFKKPRKSKGKPRGKPFQPGDPRAGRPKGRQNDATLEVRDMAGKILESKEYRQSIKVRVMEGTLPPAVETMLWYYRYGKPKEMVELTGKDGKDLMSAARVDVMAALRSAVPVPPVAAKTSETKEE